MDIDRTFYSPDIDLDWDSRFSQKQKIEWNSTSDETIIMHDLMT